MSAKGHRGLRLPAWLAWLATLKFKIVLVAAATAMLSALGTVQMVAPTAQRGVEQLLLDSAAQERVAMAGLLSSKLQMLKTLLRSSARLLGPADLADAARMAQHLQQMSVLHTLFNTLFLVAPDGQMLARLENERVVTAGLPSIADRAYFQQLMRGDQPVVSPPIRSRFTQAPVVLVVVPVLGPGNRVVGVLGGSIELQSSALLADVLSRVVSSGTRDLIMDRSGTLLAHSDPGRVMGRAVDEPGLAPIVQQWLASGSPINTEGIGQHADGSLVSMAGIPLSDWVLVRLTDESVALAPVLAARHAAWQAAAMIGVLAAALAGALAWAMTQPISQLRDRAHRLLTAPDADISPWPSSAGELGELARAFETLVAQRAQRHAEAQALLSQLEAVLDHAEVGIALTREGRFELVSRQFCRVFGCDKQQMIGQSTRIIYASDADFEALCMRAMPDFMAHGMFQSELPLVRHTGQPFWAMMRGRAVAPGDLTQGTVWTMEDVTAARAQRERLSFSATHDSLTGLANRDAYERALDEAIAQVTTRPFCALFIDLDRFKQVNDSGGHAAGDALLRDIAQCIAMPLRKSDLVARLGGDEFAVLLRDCPPMQAARVAEQIRVGVQGYRLAWEARHHSVGASVGAVFVDAAFQNAADVLRAADAACYAAKRTGRDRVCWSAGPAVCAETAVAAVA